MVEMRVFATYLWAILAITGSFLALPGTVQASEHAISSNIQQELEAIARESALQAEELSYTDLVVSVKTIRIRGADILEVPADLLPLAANSFEWAELAAYDELRQSRLTIAAKAQRRKPAQLLPLPMIPDSPAALTMNGNSSGGLIVSSAHSEASLQFSARLRPEDKGKIQGFRDAAVNLARRDYYSNRNGYHGRIEFASYPSLSAIIPPFLLSALISFTPSRDVFTHLNSGNAPEHCTYSSLSNNEIGRIALSIAQHWKHA